MNVCISVLKVREGSGSGHYLMTHLPLQELVRIFDSEQKKRKHRSTGTVAGWRMSYSRKSKQESVLNQTDDRYTQGCLGIKG